MAGEVVVDADWHRREGVYANNAAHALLAAEREASGDELLLRTVYAAAYHGQLTPSARPENEARANYLIALAQPATGWPAAAMGAADRCLVVCEQHGLADFAVDPVI